MKTKFYPLAILAALTISSVNIQAQTRSDNNRGQRETTVNNNRNDRYETRTTTQNKDNSQKNVSQKRDNHQSNDYNRPNNNVYKVKEKKIKHYPKKSSVVVTNRPDRIVHTIDNGYTRIHHGGIDYSYRDGRYYRHNNGQYVVIAPPRGIRVTTIPRNYFTIMVGAVPYYYYSGVYYKYYDTYSNYEVVEPPMGAIVPELPSDYVRAVVINRKTYFEYDNVLYKPVNTRYGMQYKVVGTLIE